MRGVRSPRLPVASGRMKQTFSTIKNKVRQEVLASWHTITRHFNCPNPVGRGQTKIHLQSRLELNLVLRLDGAVGFDDLLSLKDCGIISTQRVNRCQTGNGLQEAVDTIQLAQLSVDSINDAAERIVGTKGSAQNGANEIAQHSIANDLDQVGAEGAPVLAGHDSGQNVSDHAAASDIS